MYGKEEGLQLGFRRRAVECRQLGRVSLRFAQLLAIDDAKDAIPLGEEGGDPWMVSMRLQRGVEEVHQLGSHIALGAKLPPKRIGGERFARKGTKIQQEQLDALASDRQRPNGLEAPSIFLHRQKRRSAPRRQGERGPPVSARGGVAHEHDLLAVEAHADHLL